MTIWSYGNDSFFDRAYIILYNYDLYTNGDTPIPQSSQAPPAVAQAHLHRSFDLWRVESGSGGVESLEDKASSCRACQKATRSIVKTCQAKKGYPSIPKFNTQVQKIYVFQTIFKCGLSKNYLFWQFKVMY